MKDKEVRELLGIGPDETLIYGEELERLADEVEAEIRAGRGLLKNADLPV